MSPVMGFSRWKQYTPIDLRPFDGTNGKPILLAIDRQVFDVTAGKSFYGPGKPCAVTQVPEPSLILTRCALFPRSP